MAMKEKILNYLKHDRSHKSGVKLYNEIGNRLSLKRQLNVQSEDKHLTAILHEELRVLAGISMEQFRLIMKNPVIPVREGAVNPRRAPVVTSPAGKGNKQSKKRKPAAKKKSAQPAKKAPKKAAQKTEEQASPIKKETTPPVDPPEISQ
jgi:hypothetical protein